MSQDQGPQREGMEPALREYLLGKLNEAEKQVLEEQLITDDELFELLDVVEDELVEDYLDAALTADERDCFEKFFLLPPEHRRKLGFAKALKRYVAGEAGE